MYFQRSPLSKCRCPIRFPIKLKCVRFLILHTVLNRGRINDLWAHWKFILEKKLIALPLYTNTLLDDSSFAVPVAPPSVCIINKRIITKLSISAEDSKTERLSNGFCVCSYVNEISIFTLVNRKLIFHAPG